MISSKALTASMEEYAGKKVSEDFAVVLRLSVATFQTSPCRLLR